MTFTYTLGGDTTLNSVRLELGDTDGARQLFADEEINDVIDEETTVYVSTARLCEILANRHARDFTFTADGASFQKGGLSDMWRKRGFDYRSKAQESQAVTVTPVDGHSDDIKADQISSDATSTRIANYG